MPCSNQTENATKCNCSFDCSHHAKCCECIRYHRTKRELPACYFDAETERTGDRSLNNYLRSQGRE